VDDRRGFTLVELALTLTVFGLLTAMSLPRVGHILRHIRIDRTTSTIAADLESAFTLAARQRKPVRISCTCGTRAYTLADRNGATVRLRRSLASSDYGVATMTFANASSATNAVIDVFPSGIASAPLTVTIASGGWTRQVTVTTAGQVRILP
jgi:prepilin-type N-terminal cleavage/methylation domain-containing protein